MQITEAIASSCLNDWRPSFFVPLSSGLEFAVFPTQMRVEPKIINFHLNRRARILEIPGSGLSILVHLGSVTPRGLALLGRSPRNYTPSMQRTLAISLRSPENLCCVIIRISQSLTGITFYWTLGISYGKHIKLTYTTSVCASQVIYHRLKVNLYARRSEYPWNAGKKRPLVIGIRSKRLQTVIVHLGKIWLTKCLELSVARVHLYQASTSFSFDVKIDF